MEPNHYEYISHHGVKGMKWGIRRAVTTSGNFWKDKVKKSISTEVPKSSDQPTRIPMSKKKSQKLSVQREREWARLYRNRSRMNNAELKRALDRLQMENQLAQQVKQASELTKDPDSRAKRYIKNMSKTLVTSTDVAQPILDALMNSHDASTPAGKAAIEALKKKKATAQTIGKLAKAARG